jgi:hypothetical protein
LFQTFPEERYGVDVFVNCLQVPVKNIERKPFADEQFDRIAGGGVEASLHFFPNGLLYVDNQTVHVMNSVMLRNKVQL